MRLNNKQKYELRKIKGIIWRTVIEINIFTPEDYKYINEMKAY